MPHSENPEIREISQRMAHLAAMLQVYNSGPQVKPLWFEYRDLRDRRKVLEDEAELAKAIAGQTADPALNSDLNGATNGEPVTSRGAPEDEAEPGDAKAGQTTAPEPSSVSIVDVQNGEPVDSRATRETGQTARPSKIVRFRLPSPDPPKEYIYVPRVDVPIPGHHRDARGRIVPDHLFHEESKE